MGDSGKNYLNVLGICWEFGENSQMHMEAVSWFCEKNTDFIICDYQERLKISFTGRQFPHLRGLIQLRLISSSCVFNIGCQESLLIIVSEAEGNALLNTEVKESMMNCALTTQN